MSKSEKKQAAIVVHEYGGPEVLKYEDVQRPEPKDDEILIRVIAAGVNAVDGSRDAGFAAHSSVWSLMRTSSPRSAS